MSWGFGMVALGAVAARSIRVLSWFLAVALLAGAAVVGPLASPSSAATISVSNETEFRAALATLSLSSTGSHTIAISTDFTITDAAGDPYYYGTRPLTIEGNGLTVTGQSGDQVGFILHDSSAPLTVRDLTVTGFSAWGAGGAIYTNLANVTIVDSTFTSNSAPGDTISYGGAIFSGNGNIDIRTSTFTNNIAFPTVAPQDWAAGGAVFAGSGTVSVTDSYFAGNSASADWAIGGAILAGGGATVVDTSFFSNDVISGSGRADGGAIATWGDGPSTVSGSYFQDNTASTASNDSSGGALYVEGGTTVTNTTFASNAVTRGVGWAGGGAIAFTSALTVRHVTASSNFAEDDGSQFVQVGFPAPLTVTGSILTDPLGGGANCALADAGSSGGYNYASDSSCFALVGTDISGGSPQLGAAADNGGLTWTMEPTSSASPVVNVIPAASCTVGFDQRGVSRPRGAACDIGAEELMVADSGIIRLAGENRYGTGAAISAYHHPFGSATTFVSTGANFPDALAGAAVAAGATSPLILTATDAIPPETASELARLRQSEGAVILGGTGVVSSAVETALDAYRNIHVGGLVSRLAGNDRYETSVAISQYGFPTADTVIVAVGSGFADALAGGPLSRLLNAPVLLTATNALPASVRAEIERLAPTTIIVLGGTGVVSDAVFADLGTLASTTVRLSGESRYETAVAISQYGWPVTTGVTSVYVATGANFPDALAGAAEAAAKGVPILLTDSNNLPAAVADEVDRLGVDAIFILGGTGVVSPTVATQLAGHLAP